ncbi:unnamed protein product [Clonostachys rhizophaga]|uniref:Tyrosinase copper-binding domain-containing protein n=1 Tax=Clonostachys rhizophaga TaxID=160324 RepID=A0A9N9VUD9_9HYPO|nr:unnamed protein product [Clonostachys rhizophaga]
MKPSTFSILAGIVSITTTANGARSDAEGVWNEAQLSYEKFTEEFLANATTSNGSCNKENVRSRQRWDDLSTDARLEYIRAVKCLYSLPSTTDPLVAPGAKTRVDDFVYTHINQTNFVHGSGIFLPWHREFMWLYESALYDECGFKGTGVPYWDWFLHTDDQASSPVFDSGPAGFGGNGLYIPHEASNDTLVDVPGPVWVDRDAGTGGGCVVDGAFANLTLTLGPVVPADTPADDPYGLKGNPRCLKRDFLQPQSSAHLTFQQAADLLETTTYAEFRAAIDQDEMHPASHKFLGADGYDWYSSPNDPVFFLLHSQVDRIWSIWQTQEYHTRTNQVGGTVTFRNTPPSANATLDTVLRMLTAGPDVLFGETVSPLENYCYRYV